MLVRAATACLSLWIRDWAAGISVWQTRHAEMVQSSAGVRAGMNKVASMLFELEMEVEGPREAPDTQAAQAASAVRQAVKDACDERSSRAVAAAVAAACEGLSSVPSAAELAQLLAARGLDVCVRKALGGGHGGQCLRNLHHSFLCCSPVKPTPPGRSQPEPTQQQQQQQQPDAPPPGAGVVVVDPSFRDQFTIAHPSPRYAAVLDALPPVFVGRLESLPALVELLCAEMAAAFRETSSLLPPWRHTKAMLSKWMPGARRSLELPAAAAAAVLAAPAGTTAAAAAPARARSALLGSAGRSAVASGGGGGSGVSSASCFGAGAGSNSSVAGSSCGGGSEPAADEAGSARSPARGGVTAVSGGCAGPQRSGSSSLGLRLVHEPRQRVVGGFELPAVVSMALC